MEQDQSAPPNHSQPAAKRRPRRRNYDELFRTIFADEALSWHLVRECLPAETAIRMDDERAAFERMADTYVKRSGGKVNFDGLFRLRLPAPGQKDEFEELFVLAEHKARADWWTLGQIATYLGEIWTVGQFQTGRGKIRRYPTVIALLLYSGLTEWPFKDILADVIESPQGVEKPASSSMAELIRTRFVRRSLAESHPDHVFSHKVLRGAVTMALLAADKKLDGVAEASDEMLVRWDRQFDHVLECIEHSNLGDYFGNWLMNAIEDRRGRLRSAEERRASRGTMREGKGTMATLAEQFMQKGHVKGLEEGRAEGQAKLVLRLLEHKFGSVAEEHRRQVLEAGPDRIDEMSVALLNATSIDEAVNGSVSG